MDDMDDAAGGEGPSGERAEEGALAEGIPRDRRGRWSRGRARNVGRLRDAERRATARRAAAAGGRDEEELVLFNGRIHTMDAAEPRRLAGA